MSLKQLGPGGFEEPGGRVFSPGNVEPGYLRLGATVTSSSTTVWSAVLVTPTLAAGTYVWDFDGAFTSAATTTGLVLGLGFSVAPSSALTTVVMGISATAVLPFASVATNGTASAPTAFLGTGSTTTTPLPVRADGTFVLTAPGTLGIYMRSEVSLSAANVLAGSWMDYRKV